MNNLIILPKISDQSLLAKKHSRSEIADRAKRAFSKSTMSMNYMHEYDKGGRKERVLLIDVNCENSSTGKIVYDLYSSLRNDGREAAICYGRGEKIEGENIYKFGLDWETKVHAGLARITGYNGYFSLLSTKRLIAFIERFKPDLIHIHELHAYFVDIRMLIEYVKEKRIPVVWTFHCEYMYTGKCGHAYECTNYQRECGNCPAVKEYPKSILFDKTRQMLQMKKELLHDLEFTIITPSMWLANRVRASFLKNKKIVVIHNGVDTSIFYHRKTEYLREELGLSVSQRVVLFVAPNVMDERKGGKWVLEIAKDMRNDKNIVFILVGGCSPAVAFPDNVQYVGCITDKNRLATFYSLADVFLLCSERETYSMTCAEALCCGTPVVGFKSGAPEMIFEEPYATFVEYGDLNALEKQISARMTIYKEEETNSLL